MQWHSVAVALCCSHDAGKMTSTVKKVASPAMSVNTRSTGSNSKMDVSMIGEIICQVVAAIKPMIASVVMAAVSALTKQIFAR